MKTVRLTLTLAAILAGYLAGTSAVVSAEEGSRQCFRRVYEPLGSCSACAASCMGGGYICCEIVVG
jgi:hypothetical protein